VWTEGQLIHGDFYGANAAAPRQLRPGEARRPDEIYHFLVWDEDMAPAANDSLMKEHWPEACLTVRQWRDKQVKQTFNPEQIARLRALSNRIDQLWEDYARDRAQGLQKSRCTASVWPLPQHAPAAHQAGPSLRSQERIKAVLEAESGAFQRLRLLMDAWCALYFQPLERAEQLPSRDAWLAAAEVLLGIGVRDSATRAMLDLQLGDAIDLEALYQASQQTLPDAARLSRAVPWFEAAREIGGEQQFHHWELIFTEILGPSVEGLPEPRGFDLIYGNPPWLKVSWNDAPLLAEYDPRLGVRKAKSADYNHARPQLLENPVRRQQYRDAFAADEGASVFLNDRTLYPALAGVQTNLYKNFIERSWALLGDQGIAGLLHPEGVFDDPKGGVFREAYYQRLVAHYQLKNERILFSDIDHTITFSVNIFRGRAGLPKFRAIFNLFDPAAIRQSQGSDNSVFLVPGIKNDQGGWETRGHPQRLLTITDRELALFAQLFEETDTPAQQARLPQVHSQPLMAVLEKFAAAPQRLGDLRGQYLATVMFDETYAQRDGIITRMEDPAYQPRRADDWVISGPHFFVANPLNKTPRTACTANGHYDPIDLEAIPDDYLPRAVYRPGDADGDLNAFRNAIPEWPKPRKPRQDDKGQWHPGFWPVADHQIPAYEALLGQPLKRHGIDPDKPSAATARQFGFFTRWQGDVEGWIEAWLAGGLELAQSRRGAEDVRLKQGEPDEVGMLGLPRPIPFMVQGVFRNMCQAANERTLIGCLAPAGVTVIHTS
jgi:hypothetical protein